MARIRAISCEVQPYHHAVGNHKMSEVRIKVEVFGQEPLFLQRPLMNDDFESLFSYLLKELKHITLEYVRG